MKHLYDSLRGIDHCTEHILFEFKYDRNLRNLENVARANSVTTSVRGKMLLALRRWRKMTWCPPC